MSKLLFIADLEKEREVIHCKVLLEMLVSMGSVIDLCLIRNGQYINIPNYNRVSFPKIIDISYDIIISFNYSKFKRIRNICRNCPVIWIDTADNDYRLISGLRWINSVDKMIFTSNIKQNKLYKFFSKLDIENSILLLPNFNVRKCISDENYNHKILVAIESVDLSISPIFSILPILNQLRFFSISLLVSKKIYPITNANIQVINRDQIRDLLDYDLVIANKDIALNAVLEGVSCIIVGEKGYGGIVRDKNLESLYCSNFNGRDGGYFGEPIPPSLLLRDISSALKSKYNDTNDSRLSTKFTEIYTHDVYIIKKIINQQFILNHLSQSQVLSSKLKISGFYSIIQVNKDQWDIVDEFSKRHFSIGKQEYSIVSKFEKPTNVEIAIIRARMSNKINIPVGFIKQLLKNKILVQDGCL